MKDLFSGAEIPDQDPVQARAAGGCPRKPRPDMAHAAQVGSGPESETCGTCAHYRSESYHDKLYRKCWLVRHRWTHGPGTDIRAKDLACAKWEPGVQDKGREGR